MRLRKRFSWNGARRRNNRTGAKTVAKRALRSEKLEQRLLLATVSWDGGLSGTGTDWNNPLNWVGDAVPGSEDDATIGSDFSDLTIQLSGNTSINSVMSEAALELASGSLSLAANSEVRSFEFSNGTLANAAELTILESLDWSGGTMTDGGIVVINVGGTATLTDRGQSLNDHHLLNQGNLIFQQSAGASLGMLNGSSIRNSIGSSTLFLSDTNIGGAANELFANDGVLVKTSLAETRIFSRLESSGSIDIQAGILRLDREGTMTGPVSLTEGSRLFLHGSYDFDLAASSALTGSGILQVNAGNSSLRGEGAISLPTIEITGGTLLAERDIAVDDLSLAAGSLQGGGTVSVAEQFDWAGGRLGLAAPAGTLVVAETATATVSGKSVELNTYNVENFGTIEVQLTSGINISNGSTIINHAGALIDLQTDVSLGGDANDLLLNEGMLRKSNGPGTATLNMRLESSGLVDIQSGILRLNREGEVTGDVLIPEASRLFLHGSYDFNLPADTVLSGPGVLQVNAFESTLRGEGLIDLPVIEITGVGTLRAERDLQVDRLAIAVGSAALIGGGTVTVADHFDWAGGRLGIDGATTGTLVIDDAATASMTGNTLLLNNHRIENRGTLNFELTGGVNVANNPVVHNHPGGLIEILSNASLGGFGSTGQLINEGTFRKSNGSGTNFVGMEFTNPGMIEVLTGTVQLANAIPNLTTALPASLDQGTWIVSSADPSVSSAALQLDNAPAIAVNRGNVILDGNTSFRNQSGDALLGELREISPAGSLVIQNGTDLTLSAGDFANNGSLTLGAASTLSINGSYTQPSEANLSIGLGGDAASGEVGRLEVSADANLAGEFTPEFVNGYGPEAGESWQTISFASRNGDFECIDIPLLGRESSLEVLRNEADVTISALVSASDLSVAPNAIVIPSEIQHGDTTTIEYTVQNLSETPALGDWVDSIYLSKNNVLDTNDRLIARQPHLGGVEGLSSYTASFDAVLPALLDGNHRILVVVDSRGAVPDTDRGNNFASSATAMEISVPELPIGSPLTTTIAPGEQLFFKFDVGLDDIAVTAELASLLQAEVYLDHRVIPTRSSFQVAGQSVDGDGTSVALSTTKTGTHFLLVHGGPAADGVQTLTLKADPVQLQIYQVSNLFAYNVGKKTFEIEGAGFTPGMEVSVRSEVGEILEPETLNILSSSQLFVTFDFEGAEAIPHEFIFLAGADTVTMPLSMLEGGSPGRLEFEIETPERTAVRGSGQLSVRYENVGDSDVGVPLLRLQQVSDDNTPILVSVPYELGETDPVRDGDSDLEILSMEGVRAGVIPPYTSATINYRFRTLQSDPTVPPHIRYRIHSPLANVDELLQYNSLLQEAPDRLSDEAWAVVVANLQDIWGMNAGDMQDAVRQTLQYLESIGDEDASLEDILAFWTNQANDAVPGGALSSATDIVLPTSGLSLDFTRVFNRPISERYRRGIFGRGWTHNFDMTLRLVEPEPNDQSNDIDPLAPRIGNPRSHLELTTPAGVRVFQGHGAQGSLGLGSLFGVPVYFFEEDGTGAKSEVFEQWLPGIAPEIPVIEEADGTRLTFTGPETPLGRRLSRVTDSYGNDLFLRYSGDLLTQVEHSDGSTLDLEYDANGLLVRVAASTGEEVTYDYDASAEHLVRVNRVDGTASYSYDSGNGPAREHALTSVTDLQGVRTEFTYTDAGRLASIRTVGVGEGVNFEYAQGKVTATNAEGSLTVSYDSKGRVTRAVDPFGNQSQFDHEQELGRTGRAITGPAQTKNASVRTLTAGIEQLERSVSPGQNNVTVNTDAAGNTTQFRYKTTTDRLRFPGDSRLISITDELDRDTKFDYDEARLTSITYPDGAQEQFSSFDDQGRALTYTNRRNELFHVQYNDAGQVTRRLLPDGDIHEFTYDARGNLRSASDNSGSTAFQYDDADRVLEVAYSNGRSINYTYNDVGQLVRVESHDGVATQYTYNVAGFLETVRDTAGDLVVSYTYDDVGRLSREDHGNGTFTTYEYNVGSQLIELRNHAPDSSINSSYLYSHDELGRRTEMVTLSGTWTYNYDAIGQLIEADFASIDSEIPDQDLEYQYDAAGNRIRMIRNGEITDYGVNNRNQYTVVGDAVYSYDAEGNLISIEGDGDETTTYEYDVEDRLVAVHSPDGTTAYEYDLFGNRVARVEDGERTEFLVDPFAPSLVLADYDGTGQRIASYSHGNFLEASSMANGERAFYDFEGAGSTIGLSDNAGNYISDYHYTPFGQELVPDTASDNRYRFIGRYGVETEGNGLHRMGARYHLDLAGRFTSEDPARHDGGLNLYRYASNDPVNYVDPLGNKGIALVKFVGQHLPFLWRRSAKPSATRMEKAEEVAQLIEQWNNDPAVESYKLLAYGDEMQRYFEGAATVIRRNPFATGGAGVATFFLAASPAEASTGSPSATGSALSALADLWLEEKLYAYGTPEDLKDGFSLFAGPFLTLDPDILCALFDCDSTESLQAEGTIVVVGSLDPNDILGPEGVGDDRHLAPRSAPLNYTVRFENVDDATAPAQRVRIEQTLDDDLDWNTFELGNVGFGQITIPVPEGRQYYSTRYDATATHGVLVDVEGEINQLTGELLWTFTALDPQTLDLPIDPLIGFLPPNQQSPEGEGFVQYRVAMKAGLATGTTIDAEAKIFFDLNDPIDTPAWTNIVDAGPPTSSVAALPPQTTAETFTVSWAGEDDAGGSGIATYDVFVSTDGGAFEPLVIETSETSTGFTGVVGSTYGFYSVATDQVGFREEEPTSAQATTTIIAVGDLTADAGGPYDVDEGSSVTLLGSGTNPTSDDPLTFAWDLDGDGTFETSGSQVAFDASGIDGPQTIEVTLRVRTSSDATATDTTTINVLNVDPTAVLGGPYETTVGEPIDLNASASSDPIDDPLSFDWDLDGDGAFDDATGEVARFPADSIGTFPVVVRVGDDDGGFTLASTTVVVVGELTADAGGPYEVDEGGSITLTGTGTDPASDDPLTLAWDLDGDGTFESAGADVTFDAVNLDGPQTATVRLQVTTSSGGIATDEATVRVTNVAPTAIVGGPFTTTQGDEIELDASASFDPIDEPLSYEWDLDGDGLFDDATGELALFPADTSGTYSVTVRVSDDDGGVGLASTDVVVREEPGNIPVIEGTSQSDLIAVRLNAHGGFTVALNGAIVLNAPLVDASGLRILAGGGNDRVLVDQAFPLPLEAHGGHGNDRLEGGSQADSMFGGQGDDVLLGRGGDDLLRGGSGRDYVKAGDGQDTVFGDSGQDLLLGGGGNDVLRGGAGRDNLRGEEGDDELVGGEGDDALGGGVGHDTLLGGVGNDALHGSGGDDTISGHTGNDFVIAGSGNDRIKGGAGNDRIVANLGDDTIFGGSGHDRIDAGGGHDLVRAGTGHDIVVSGHGDDLSIGGEDNDIIWAGQGNDRLFGNRGDDTLVGFPGQNLLHGGLDDDHLFGDSDDELIGGGGDDCFYRWEFVAGPIANGSGCGRGSSPLDTNRDRLITAMDALLVINSLNRGSESEPAERLDTNADGYLTSGDVLLVVNFLNRRSSEATFEPLESQFNSDQIRENPFEKQLDDAYRLDFDEELPVVSTQFQDAQTAYERHVDDYFNESVSEAESLIYRIDELSQTS